MPGWQSSPGSPASHPKGLASLALGLALAAAPALVLGQVPGAGPAPPTSPPPRTDAVGAELERSRGVVSFEAGRYDEALKSFERVGTAADGDASSRYYRGLSLLALRRAREALAEFQAVRSRPSAPAEVDLDLGMAQLAAGQVEQARATLEAYTRAHPDDPFGHYFLGIVLFRQKKHAEAVVAFDAASRDARLRPYRDFYQGLIDYEKGDQQYRDRLDQFQRLAGNGAAGSLSRRLAATAPTAANLLQPATAPEGSVPTGYGRPSDPQADPDRRYNFTFLTGYEYDTNIALAPALPITGLGAGFNKPDSRWVVSSFFEYRLLQEESYVLGLLASNYNSFQFRLGQFDVQDYMGGAYGNMALGEFILGARYEFHETLLGRKQFTTDHRLTPNLTYREGKFGHTTAYYEFDAIDVDGFALVPAQRRSGNVNAVGVTQAIYTFGGAGRIYLGYRFEDAATQGSDFDRRTNMITARAEAPLPGQVVGYAEFRQFWDDYRFPNSLDFFGRPRSDTRSEARVGFQKFFTPRISFRAEYLYTINDSNVENLFGAGFYTYDRHLLSTLLIFDF